MGGLDPISVQEAVQQERVIEYDAEQVTETHEQAAARLAAPRSHGYMEDWTVLSRSDEHLLEILDRAGFTVANLMDSDLDVDVQQAYAERIALCVNLLAGVADQEIMRLLQWRKSTSYSGHFFVETGGSAR